METDSFEYFKYPSMLSRTLFVIAVLVTLFKIFVKDIVKAFGRN